MQANAARLPASGHGDEGPIRKSGESPPCTRLFYLLVPQQSLQHRSRFRWIITQGVFRGSPLLDCVWFASAHYTSLFQIVLMPTSLQSDGTEQVHFSKLRSLWIDFVSPHFAQSPCSRGSFSVHLFMHTRARAMARRSGVWCLCFTSSPE